MDTHTLSYREQAISSCIAYFPKPGGNILAETALVRDLVQQLLGAYKDNPTAWGSPMSQHTSQSSHCNASLTEDVELVYIAVLLGKEVEGAKRDVFLNLDNIA